MSIRKTNDSKLVESDMLDVREPAWGDNLDPDSKNYIYGRSKTYRKGTKNPIKNFQGERELANALKWKNKLATGDYTSDELNKALDKEMKDLEKIKKKLGRDFKADELTEMLLYLNDTLRDMGINLRPDLMSKKDFLAAQSAIEDLLDTEDEDIEEDFEEDFEEEEEELDEACGSKKRVKESADDDLELDSMRVDYKLYIMWKPHWSKSSKTWNRVQNSKDWDRMSVALTVERDEDSDEDDPMYIVVARNAKTGDFLASGYNAEDLINNLLNNSEDYWDSSEYDAMDIYYNINELQKAIDEAKTSIEMGFGLEESTERVRESEEALYIIYGVNSRGERKGKPLAEFSSLDRAIDYSKNILKGKCAIVERTWDEEESDYVEEEVWSSMKESKTFKKLQRVREAAANYEIYICDGNRAASRGMEEDDFEVVSMSFESDAEAYLYGYLACEAMDEGYFDEADWSLNDLIEQYNEEHTPHWEVPREDEDEEYKVEDGESPEIEKYLKDASEAKELLYGQDPGFGAPFVYGVKKNGTLIYDLDFEEIEKDRLYLEEELEEF